PDSIYHWLFEYSRYDYPTEIRELRKGVSQSFKGLLKDLVDVLRDDRFNTTTNRSQSSVEYSGQHGINNIYRNIKYKLFDALHNRADECEYPEVVEEFRYVDELPDARGQAAEDHVDDQGFDTELADHELRQDAHNAANDRPDPDRLEQ